MSPDVLQQHVEALAQAIGANVRYELCEVWPDDCWTGRPSGALTLIHPPRGGRNIEAYVDLSHEPREGLEPYLIALHELGHARHALRRNGKFRSRLPGTQRENEVYAWRFALRHTLVPPCPELWEVIAFHLGTYRDHCPTCKPNRDFDSLLAEAERNAMNYRPAPPRPPKAPPIIVPR